QPFHVAESRQVDGARGRGAHYEAARPRVAQERLVRRDRALPDSDVPVVSGCGKVDLVDDEVDHCVHEVPLVDDVVVQGHGFDTQFAGERAHRQRLDPALVGESDGGAQHPFPAERGPGPATGAGRRHRVDKLTAYVYVYTVSIQRM